jgi:transposase
VKVATSGTRGSGDATQATEVVLGVDTHLDFHVVVVLDHLGRRLGEAKVATTSKGYRNLVCWAEGFGRVRCAGVEGTGSYGAGLARHLKAAGIAVMEVERPKRSQRSSRRRGKSDPIDAERAARAVLAGEAAGVIDELIARADHHLARADERQVRLRGHSPMLQRRVQLWVNSVKTSQFPK